MTAPNPLAIAAELEGSAEGSTSACASLMRDAAAVIRGLLARIDALEPKRCGIDEYGKAFHGRTCECWGPR